jgi:hypothetical protein
MTLKLIPANGVKTSFAMGAIGKIVYESRAPVPNAPHA